MNKIIFGASMTVALFTSACATYAPIPTTRKLSSDVMAQIAETDVVVMTNQGVRASWTSAGAAQGGYTNYTYIAPGVSPLAAGIGAGIGQAIAIAIMDAAPSARAKKSVRKINTGLDKEALDEALLTKIRSMSTATGIVSLGEVSATQFDRKTPMPQDRLVVNASYTLAEDASAVIVSANVTYENDDILYQTPYDFGGKPPKSEKKGALYMNTFTYHSNKFDAPELTVNVRKDLKTAILSQFEDDISNVDASLSAGKKDKQIKKLKSQRDKALGNIDDNRLSKSERAILLIDRWRGNGSPALMAAINEGQSFIAEMLIKDINDASVPQFPPKEPKEEGGFFKGVELGVYPLYKEEFSVISTSDNGRQIVRLDSGLNSGAYHSYPESGFSTYGNTFKIAK